MAMPYALQSHSCATGAGPFVDQLNRWSQLSITVGSCGCIAVAFKRKTFLLCNSKFMI